MLDVVPLVPYDISLLQHLQESHKFQLLSYVASFGGQDFLPTTIDLNNDQQESNNHFGGAWKRYSLS